MGGSVVSSFMSEHSTEYALVNSIVKHLSVEFPIIIPIYLWLTREGNNLGKDCLLGRQVRLISVFPRRPKVSFPGQGEILVKFNSSILGWASAAQSLGIPVFAGVPLVSDLSAYRFNTHCSWFYLLGYEFARFDIEILLSRKGEFIDHSISHEEFLCGPLDRQAILEHTRNNSGRDQWQTWLEKIRSIREILAGRDFSMYGIYGATYKPFFLVLPLENG